MTEKEWKYLFQAIVILGIGLLCFYLGRKTIKEPTPKVVTEYIKGDTIRDTIETLKPYKVVEPVDTLNIIKQCIKDGIYAELWPTRTEYKEIIVTKEDTTTIMKDWATKRYYSETLFDSDTLGTCKFDSEVQYNRMRVMSYEYTPVTKVVTKTEYVTKLFSPYIGAGALYNPWDEIKNPMLQVNGGFFIKEKYGVQLQYQHAFTSKDDYIGGAILYKF